MVGQVAAEEATTDRVREIIALALNIDQALKCECPDCGSNFVAKVPDVSKMLRNAIEVLEQVEGKAGDQQTVAPTVIVERPAYKA